MNKQYATVWNFSFGDVVLTFLKGSFFPCQHYFSCDRRIHTMVSIPYAHIILTGKICILFTSSFADFFSLFRMESQKPIKWRGRVCIYRITKLPHVLTYMRKTIENYVISTQSTFPFKTHKSRKWGCCCCCCFFSLVHTRTWNPVAFRL